MRNRARLTAWTTALCLVLALCIQALASANPQEKPSSAATASAAVPAKAASSPSAADIATAKATGKVWVNLDSGIYHKGGRWYGKTKNGKFMTADEAKKAGYKVAKRD